MEQHLSPSTLAGYFLGHVRPRHEAEAIASHLARCPACWKRAAGVLADLEAARAEEDRMAVGRLRASGRWAELAGLSPEQQNRRIQAEADLRAPEMFETVLGAASSIAPDDPFLGEETALVAYAMAGKLSRDVCSETQRSDLQSTALKVVANCRRLTADWRGSAEALKKARRHLESGTGEPELEAALLSIESSLAADTGHLEFAEASLARAAAIYRHAGNPAALASAAVQEAGLLLAACRYEQAIARAEEALRLLTPKDTRLELLASNIITASLVFLGRPGAAFRSYVATHPPSEHLPERRSDRQADYLEALLLDSLGHAREAEMAFRYYIDDLMEAELYKEAFLVMLTRFELLFQRGALDNAARACEEALASMQAAEVPCREPMEALWRGLWTLVKARSLSAVQLVKARRYLVRHWHGPASGSPLEGFAGGSAGAAEPLPAQENIVIPSELRRSADLSRPAEDATGEAYEAALERYDRALIRKGLAQCGGRVAQAARLLGIAPGTLRSKIKRYGLAPEAPRDGAEEDAESLGLAGLGEEERAALGRMRARVWWKSLQPLSTTEQIARVKTVRMLQTRELAETILEDAAAKAQSDPRRGEEAAFVACTVAGLIPASRCPLPVKHDLQGAALAVAANCRRLAGGWQGAAAALDDARGHLGRGTGDPAREARLLSIRASLAADMGHHEQALSLLARASVLYRNIRDAAGAAFTAVQEAGTLLAAGRHSEAVERAEEALLLLTPRQVRLELLARNIITSSLVYLGRPMAAVRSLHATRPLFEELRAPWSATQLEYLEALVLDSLGLDREADAAFRRNIERLVEAGLHKDAFLILLTRFELAFKRGEPGKAARVCEEAIGRLKKAGEDRHAQTIQLWRDLLALAEARRLTDLHLRETEKALARCWASPEQQGTALVNAAPATDREWISENRPGRQRLTAQPPPVPDRLAAGEYEKVLARYDRVLIAEGLARCHGNMAETCAALGISRNKLRARMRQYGLKGKVTKAG